MAAAGEADQVADQRSVDALAALVRGNAGEVESSSMSFWSRL